MFKKILIANRGEIACRIARTCRRMGVEAATVHSTADEDALHVKVIGDSVEIGGPAAADSYLNMERIIAAAKQTGAEAIHPGFGFLAENSEFVRKVEQAGLVFIGPTADVIERLGDKATAKHEAIKAKVPVIPGTERPSDDAAVLATAARAMTLPIMLKAAAGGGGKGMRMLESFDKLEEEIEAAMREGLNAFGNAALIIEKLIQKGRHIEIQIAGDGEGNVVHLFERECSLQRRHQKVIEEAPAANLDSTLRDMMAQNAVNLGKSLQYRGVGTVEFIVNDEGYFFLEVNPRLQVEHPVTEEITGIDIVELQLRIACGEGLGITQDEICINGHAAEARIYAEDPAAGFLPSTGVLSYVRFPESGVRVETGVESGGEVTPYYDPMIAKLIAHGKSRNEALDKLSLAVDGTSVFGVTTNRIFLKKLLNLKETRNATFYTVMIDDMFESWDLGSSADQCQVMAIAAYFWLSNQRQHATTARPWHSWGNTGWATGGGGGELSPIPILHLTSEGHSAEIRFGSLRADGRMRVAVGDDIVDLNLKSLGGNQYLAVFENRRGRVTLVHDGDRVFVQDGSGTHQFTTLSYLSYISAIQQVSGDLKAPMMGLVLKVAVKVGDPVSAGDTILIIESMKMELRVNSEVSGIVKELRCTQGQMVERHQIVAVIEQHEDQAGLDSGISGGALACSSRT